MQYEDVVNSLQFDTNKIVVGSGTSLKVSQPVTRRQKSEWVRGAMVVRDA
jgi:hypothetical protein